MTSAASPTPPASCLAVVLAAGEGTRMASARPKVLHEVAGRSMLAHVLAALSRAGASRLAVVVGPGRDDVAREARRAVPEAAVFTQHERLGTAHAVLTARGALEEGAAEIVVAFADTPLITPETFDRLRRPLGEGAAIAVLGFEARDPTGYGRLIARDGQLAAIREQKDATEHERAISLCNGGLMALRGDVALDLLDRIENRNAQGEYYLTDVVELANHAGHRVVTVMASEEEVQGVNDRAQLAAVERFMQERLRRAAMASGVTLIAPETVFFSHDTRVGRDTVVEPNVVFGPGVVIGENAIIHAFSHLEGAHVAPGASVGPFARLRPGALIGPKAKVGNFVEIKNTELGAGAKVSHLTYLGDATVGAEANIGAGTITCNYDGFNKYRTAIGEGAFIGSNSSLVAPVTIGDGAGAKVSHLTYLGDATVGAEANIGAGTITCNYDGFNKYRTAIGEGAFIGSNSSLVAPVTIGDGAYVGSGSVITEDVPGDALGVARGRQALKEGWAKAFRARAALAKRK